MEIVFAFLSVFAIVILSWSASCICQNELTLHLVNWAWSAQIAYTEIVFPFLSVLAIAYCLGQQTAYDEMNLHYIRFVEASITCP